MKWTNTTYCFTEPVTKLSPRNTNFILEILHICQYVFKKSLCAAAYTNYNNTQVFSDKRPTDYRGYASEIPRPYYLTL